MSSKYCIQKGCLNRDAEHSFCKQQELTRLKEDDCYLQNRLYQSTKPLKYITYNYHPFCSDIRATNYVGTFYSDGYVGGCTIEDETALKLSEGNVLTNNRVKQNLGYLRPNAPRIKGYFHSDTDSALRPMYNKPKGKNCKPTEVNQFEHSMQYFSHLCYNPNKPIHVVPNLTVWGGNAAPASTRNNLREYSLRTEGARTEAAVMQNEYC
jgi:hypothetical protein